MRFHVDEFDRGWYTSLSLFGVWWLDLIPDSGWRNMNDKILILGGGFAGVYTARTLEKLLRPGEADITLVNRDAERGTRPIYPGNGYG